MKNTASIRSMKYSPMGEQYRNTTVKKQFATGTSTCVYQLNRP